MTAPQINRRASSPTISEVTWFVLAGAVNAASYLVVSYLLIQHLATSVFWATTLGFLVSAVVSFVLNASLTFDRGRVTSGLQAGKFIALCGIGYLYNLVVIWCGTGLLGIPFLVTVAAVTVTWPVCSFLLSKFVVFR